ncbi:EF-hand domain-containing protein [Dyella telluris]|uniref:EF-hand domain-containing protein n=1 Tax=Dyella telluris TaxID=2763498 RepID=A0A7G8Q8V6_9GAMM|nr:EF-hand domain-containing protein [Dyella telluris]QNK03214.1 EF-hand domain-containing protein [Dyella telluris]
MRHTLLVIAALAALAATASHAQTGLGPIANQVQNAAKNFDIADKNKDGLLTKEEAEKGPVPFIRAHFDAIDKNHRGVVSKQDVADYIGSLQRPQGAPAPAPAASTH